MLIKVMTNAEYVKYTSLLHRIKSDEVRARWAPYSSNQDDFDMLIEAILPTTCEMFVDEETTKHRYFIEPMAPYGTLHTLIKQSKTLDEAHAQQITRQLLAIIAFCHTALGVIIRDLKMIKLAFLDAKMTRIRLTDPLHLHVCDHIDNDTLMDQEGCPAYVSPEMLSRMPFGGRAADMWSVGVLIYVMLVGRYPFYETTSTRLYEKIIAGEFYIPIVLDCSLDVRIIIHSLLRLAPRTRPSALDLLRTAWFQPGHVQRMRKLAPLTAAQRLMRHGRDYDDDDAVVPQKKRITKKAEIL